MKAYARMDAQNMDVQLIEQHTPMIDRNEILVEMKAFGVGVHDRYFIPQDCDFPYTIGSEGAGVIKEIGADVKNLKIGDPVIVSSGLAPKGGSWAEYIALSSQNVIPMPKELDFTEGAAIPVAGKTALECIHALALQAGDTLFVAGASGAIGTLVVQLAVARGIHVIGSASLKNHPHIQSLGVEVAVDYNEPDWQGQVIQKVPNGVDAALAILPGTGVDCLNIVKEHGLVVTVSGDTFPSQRKIVVKQFQHRLNLQDSIGYLAKEVASGNLKIIIEQLFPFEEAISALEKTETRHAKGKIVVTR